MTDTVSILNLDQGTWRTSYDGLSFPDIQPFPLKVRSLTLKNVNGDIFAFGGHDGTAPLDTVREWNSAILFGEWGDTGLTIPEAAEDPTIIPYNFWEKCLKSIHNVLNPKNAKESLLLTYYGL